jgi:DNA-binding response OmpR family regulator
MKRNTDRLLRLINKVLDIRKLDSGFLNINLKNDDVIQFIKSLAGSFDFKAEQKKIIFRKVFHQLSYQAWFDPDVIDKIVFNLLSNAFKFTPDGGEISIEAVVFEYGSDRWQQEKESCGITTSANLMKISVKDSGIGIPYEQQLKVFDRFYQANNRASRSGGSGIGLALVKELVELVEGKVKVMSEVEVGSCFMIWIPLDQNINDAEHLTKIQEAVGVSQDENDAMFVQLKSEKKALHSEQAIEKPLILIVEDNLDMQQFVSGILQNDFEILTAGNGKIGFEIALEYIPDLIVSDIMMPDMDGMEMCQLIRSNERTNHIPVILLTARSTDEYQIEGLFAGADDYIMKPFSAKNLLLRVTNIIRSRQLLREKFSLADFNNNSSKASTVDDAFVNKIRDIVEKHIDNPEFDPQLFASEVGMSRAQFYRKLKAVTNQSVNDFIFSVRINVAVKLMLNDNLSISETAYAVGFKTPAHFSKIFSAHMAMSPSKYIELHRKK